MENYEVFSAGTKPSQVRREAIAVMRKSELTSPGIVRNRSTSLPGGHLRLRCNCVRQRSGQLPGVSGRRQTHALGLQKIQRQSREQTRSASGHSGALGIRFMSVSGLFSRPGRKIGSKSSPAADPAVLVSTLPIIRRQSWLQTKAGLNRWDSCAERIAYPASSSCAGPGFL